MGILSSMTLVICQAQLETFGEASRHRFESRLCDLVRQHWRESCEAMSPSDLHKFVEDGIARGRRYGLTSERDLARFVNVQFALGAEFDADPRHAWAADVLKASGVPASTRVDQLCELTAGALR